MRILYWILLVLGFGLAACSRPVANFTFDQARPQAPAQVEFTNKSEKATAYKWEFGDGVVSKEKHPKHRYTASGTYQVILEASDGKKTKQTTKTIRVDAPKDCLVEIETPFGNMIVRLSDATPLHRDNSLE